MGILKIFLSFSQGNEYRILMQLIESESLSFFFLWCFLNIICLKFWRFDAVKLLESLILYGTRLKSLHNINSLPSHYHSMNLEKRIFKPDYLIYANPYPSLLIIPFNWVDLGMKNLLFTHAHIKHKMKLTLW